MANEYLYQSHSAPASEEDCAWCGEEAVKAIKNRRAAGQYIYVCARHIKQAEAHNTNKPRGT